LSNKNGYHSRLKPIVVYFAIAAMAMLAMVVVEESGILQKVYAPYVNRRPVGGVIRPLPPP